MCSCRRFGDKNRMITKTQWYRHPTLRSELEELLKNPVLIAALEVVFQLGVKSTAFPVNPVDLVQFFALMGAKRDGYIEALANLQMLAKPEPEEKPTPKPWDTPQPAQ